LSVHKFANNVFTVAPPALARQNIISMPQDETDLLFHTSIGRPKKNFSHETELSFKFSVFSPKNKVRPPAENRKQCVFAAQQKNLENVRRIFPETIPNPSWNRTKNKVHPPACLALRR
jgi:hypothetical protein